MNLITLSGYAAAVLTASSFLPQAVKTIRTKNTSGISLFMYSLFVAGTFLWFLFGLFSNNMPVMLANALTLVFSAIVLVCKIKYR